MRIIKKINNNVAVGLDSTGREIVVFGKGIGFNPVPYELLDLTKVDRTFYDIDKRYYHLFKDVPEDIFLLVSSLVDVIKTKVKGNLNPNLAFLLTDHINFAIERSRKGMEIPLQNFYELEYDQPELTQMAQWFVNAINERLGVNLDQREVGSITMHLLNALEGRQGEETDQEFRVTLNRIIDTITRIIEQDLNISIDRNSFYYFRFKLHLKYFMQRKRNGEQLSNKDDKLYLSIRDTYPDIYRCARHIDAYLDEEFGERCPSEELLYLMVHIIQLHNKEDCNRKGITPKQ